MTVLTTAARAQRFILLQLSVAAMLMACADTAVTEPPDPGTGGPGGPPPGVTTQYVVRGRVTDAQGRPIAGAQIIIDNTIYYNSGVTTQTGSDGSYSARVTDGSWRALARIHHAYNGRTYEFDLAPDNTNSFAGIDGAVRNFTWKLAGAAPLYLGREYFGGAVDLLLDPMADFYDLENVEFTFTPVGPLVDGSTGQSFTAKSGAARTPTYSKIVDVPIGRYRVTARHVPPGGPAKELKIRVEGNSPFAASVTADFMPEQMACTNCMRLEITP